jgi:hypothetical protein
MYLDGTGALRTMKKETVLKGRILPTSLYLDETWRWWTEATETLPAIEHWFQHELYTGVPSNMPHARAVDEPTHGAYLANYALIKNDCGFAPYASNRLLLALPVDDGFWPRVTGFDREPYVTPDANGRFSAPFARVTNYWNYIYAIDGVTDGHDINIDMTIERRDRATSELDCTATYRISGEKLYQSAHP